MSQIFISHSPQETSQLATELLQENWWDLHTKCLVFLLTGDFGSGKTQFVKGLASELGVESEIISPSYLYSKTYAYAHNNLAGELVHIDAWRIEQGSTWESLGFHEVFKPHNVIAIEWPSAATPVDSSENALLIKIDFKGVGEEPREVRIEVQASGF